MIKVCTLGCQKKIIIQKKTKLIVDLISYSDGTKSIMQIANKLQVSQKKNRIFSKIIKV